MNDAKTNPCIRAGRHAVTALLTVLAVVLLPMSAAARQGEATEAADLPLGFTLEEIVALAQESDTDIHDLFYSLRPYDENNACVLCHEDEAVEILDTGHFKWEGKVEGIVGLEGTVHGKKDLLNNFCIAVPSNEARCTQCHTGIGWRDKDYDFQNPANVDCLVCHDQSGTYSKEPKTAGAPPPSLDLNAVARSVSIGSTPTRKNCIGCHANAGGGNNVKHGDLSTNLVATTREYDVHMGTDGADLPCIACHDANHDPKSGAVNHGNAGMALHSVHEGEMRQCVDCHGSQQAVHRDTGVEHLLFSEGWHERLACQTCHIPAIARKDATKMEWYWSDAGQDITPPTDPVTGKPTYDKMKGSFVWANDVRPVLRWYNGQWERKVIGVSDSYDTVPIPMAEPQGSYDDPKAMIYPFKLMRGNQPVDTVNQIVLVPHLFPGPAGPNAYWKEYQWGPALQEGAAYAGQNYSGTYGFVDTTMLLTVNHEVAPAENALGNGGMPDACMDCHETEFVDWEALGWTDDPLRGGNRHMVAPRPSTSATARLD